MKKRTVILWGFVLSAWAGYPASAGAADPEPLVVDCALTLHELRHDPEAPDLFDLRFRLRLRWDPAVRPDWEPWTDLRFANAVGPVEKTRVLPRGLGAAGEAVLDGEGASETWHVEGGFKGYNNFPEYPLDEHELGIVLLSRSLSGDELRFRSRAEWLNVRPTFPGRIEGWSLLAIGFHDHPGRFLHSLATTDDGSPPAFAGWEFVVERSRAVVFVQLLLPMLVLWLFSYLGFFWKGDSPASRFSTAAMFAAIALYLGTRTTTPNVGYLLDLHALFLALYAAIGANALLAAVVFHHVDRGDRDRADRWRKGAKAGSPAFAAALVVLVLLLGNLKTVDAVFEGEAPIWVELDQR